MDARKLTPKNTFLRSILKIERRRKPGKHRVGKPMGGMQVDWILFNHNFGQLETYSTISTPTSSFVCLL